MLVQLAKSGDLDVKRQATWGMSVEVFDSRGLPRFKVDLAGNNLGELPTNRRLP